MKSIKLELTLKYAVLIAIIILIIAVVSVNLSKQILNAHIRDTKLQSNMQIFKEFIKQEYQSLKIENEELVGENGKKIKENYPRFAKYFRKLKFMIKSSQALRANFFVKF